MLDQEKFTNPEELITCPYKPAHNVLRKRMAFHLSKCRKQHPDLARQLKTCQLNVQHQIPQPEFEFHMETCPDRMSLHVHIYKFNNGLNDTVKNLMKNTEIPIEIPVIENWDGEITPQINIIDGIQREAKNRGVLQNHSNEPPSVRKAKREEDRRLAKERMVKEEIAMLDPRTYVSSSTTKQASSSFHGGRNGSVDEDSLSITSFETAKSYVSKMESDVSLNTAITATMNRLQEMNLHERTAGNKKRGRGQPRVPTTTVQAGLGRGRRNQ